MNEVTNGAVAAKGAGGARLEKKKGSKTPLIVLGVLLALALCVYLTLCLLARRSDAFFPNSTLAGVEVSGMSAAQAADALAAQLPAREYGVCLDGAKEPEVQFTAGEFGLFAPEDMERAAFAAYNHQHNRSFLAGGVNYLMALLGRDALPQALRPDEGAVARAAAELKAELDRPAQDASYVLNQNSVEVTTARDGRSVDAAALEGMLSVALGAHTGSAFVGLDTTPIPAKAVTAQDIHDTIYGEMKNAGYDAATGTITPEQMGADFDVPAAQRLMDGAQPGDTVSIPATIQIPSVTAAELKEVLFRDVLGECKTKVGGTAARKTNVRLAAEKVNGYVMNTGDVFSYNEAVGKRTAERGFQAAPAYVKGETVDEIGGGICQVSSTLYYACLRGNLEITERYAHRYVPSYIDWGMDATVSWGGPDYKFTNDTLYPIKIQTSYQDGYITVRLLGTNIDGTYARMTNEVLSRTDWETEYREDAAVAPGTEQVKVTPYTGYQVKSYRHVYDKDGNLISSAFEASSNYKVRNKVILRAPGQLPGAEVPAVAPITPEVPVTPPEPDPPTVPETPVVPDPPEETPVEAPEEPPETAGQTDEAAGEVITGDAA